MGSTYWINGDASGGSTNANGNISVCGGVSTLFGYGDRTVDKYFSQEVSYSGLNYYASSIKLTILFIDEWPSTLAIMIYRGSISGDPIWTWSYNDNETYGEHLCGTNKMDYVLSISAEIPA